MLRQTSIDSYHELEETGKLGKLQREVYDYIKEHLGCTQSECASSLKKRRGSIGPRFAELYNKGIIDYGIKRECEITTNVVMTWKVIPKRVMKVNCCPHCKQVVNKEVLE